MTTSILLDTHILLWWRTQPQKLSAEQLETLREVASARGLLAISAITLWELAMLVARGRINVNRPIDLWLHEIESSRLLSVLPITARVAMESVQLGPDFHKDPADQIIVATARCHGLLLATADRRIHEWGKVALA